MLKGAAPGPSRGYCYIVAKLLGHASPSVSLGHYIHAADLLLGSITWRASQQIPKPVWLKASSRGKSVNYDRLKADNTIEYFAGMVEMLDIQRRLFDRTSGADTLKTETPRRPKAPEKEAFDGNNLSFETCALIYNLAISEKRPLDEIAARLQITTALISRILKAASEWTNRLGLKNGEALYIPRTPAESAFFEDMNLRLLKLFRTDPAIVDRGLTLHLEHYYAHKGKDVVFRNASDTKDLEEYLSFVQRLNLPSKRLRWNLRYPDNSTQPPDWAATRIRQFGRIKFHNLGAPSKIRPTGNSQWIGLLFLDEEQKGCGALMATIAVLAKIILKICFTCPRSTNN